jgi:hypothetical protein
MYKSGRGRGHGPRRDCGYCGLFGVRGDVHRFVCVESQEARAGNTVHRGGLMLIVRVYCSEIRGDDGANRLAAGGAGRGGGLAAHVGLAAGSAEAVAARGDEAQARVSVDETVVEADGAREPERLVGLCRCAAERLVGLFRCAGVVVLSDGLEPALDDVALVGRVGLVRVPVVLRLVDVLELLLEQVDLVAVVDRVVAVHGTLCHAGGVVRGGALLEAGFAGLAFVVLVAGGREDETRDRD